MTMAMAMAILIAICFAIPADIVFKYRQKVTRSFDHLTGEYYIAPVFMVPIFFSHALHQNTRWHIPLLHTY